MTDWRPSDQPAPLTISVGTVLLIFLRLGLTSFGGPVAHLGYFREEFVKRRCWLSEQAYADLVALCQFLPGPASSQVGLVLGFTQAGYRGALAAWAGFTLPSAILLILLAIGMSTWHDNVSAGVLHGLKIVAVAVVAQAVWGMARSLCTDTWRVTIMACAACLILLYPAAQVQVAVIVLAGLTGLLCCKSVSSATNSELTISMRRRSGAFLWIAFIVLLLVLPLLAKAWPGQPLAMIDAFFRAGSLVFGGGHVVLPLLRAEVVPTGWLDDEIFLAGYGAVQAVPGPLFTFAAFLGAAMQPGSGAWIGGLTALVAIFVPSFLLVIGALPYWQTLRRHARTQAVLVGINAAVVGILLASLYNPVWTSAIRQPADFAVALLALIALMFWRWPPWLVVLAGGVAGSLLLS